MSGLELRCEIQRLRAENDRLRESLREIRRLYLESSWKRGEGTDQNGTLMMIEATKALEQDHVAECRPACPAQG